MLKLRAQIKAVVKTALVSGRQHDASKFPLLQLPAELMYDITGYLELHELYLVSQTCRALRRLTHERVETELRALGIFPEVTPSSGCADCTKSSTCPSCVAALEVRTKKVATHRKAIFNFWAGLSNFLPDRWACRHCKALHPINQQDLQAFRREPHRFCHSRSGPGLIGTACFYVVREAHIQLALKLTRFGDFHRNHLKTLMKPSSYTFRGSFPHRLHEDYVYEATQKVVNGRSMLREKWTIGTLPTLQMTPHSLWFLELCPHMATVDWGTLSEVSPRQHGLTDFQEHVEYAYRKSRNRPYESFGHCSLCLTDFSVKFYGNQAHIAAWYDFGSCDSPADDAWMAHHRFPETQERPFQRCREFSHDNGDVRRMFLTERPYIYNLQPS